MKSIILKAVLIVFCCSLITLPVFADSKVGDICSSNASQTVKDAAGCSGGSDDLPNVVVGILNAIIGVAGVIAVIWIIIGGVWYMTSSGDTGKVKKAKDTILYACIGLTICVLSFAIVNFLVKDIIEGSDGGDKGNSKDKDKDKDKSDDEEKESYIDTRIKEDLAFLQQ